MSKKALHKAAQALEARKEERQVEAPDSPSPAAINADTSTADRYLPLFRSIIGRYLDQMAAMNALGYYNITDYCRICAGGGIHSIGCACVCHVARKALAEYDEEKHPAAN